MERTCKKCGETKPLEEFRKNKRCQFGRAHTCSACKHAINARQSAVRRAAETDAPPATRLCRGCGETKPFEEFGQSEGARWGRGHVCMTCKWARRDRASARRTDQAKRKRLQEVAPDAVAAKTFEDNARRRGALIVERVVPLVVLERDDGECGVCGSDVDPFGDFEIDHIVAIADGGEHSYENVQLAHPACNRRKAVEERDARKAAATA